MKWFLGGSCVLIASLVGWQAYQAKGIRTLTVLPLNGGLSVVVDEPNVGGTMLVDCGNTQTFDSVLTPFLHAQGKERIGSFFITHGDIRHMGAAASVLRDFEPRMLAVSDVRFRSSSYRDIVDGAISEPTILTNLSSGDSLVGWTVLYPPANLKVTRADQGVMVLQGQMGGATTLLLSDLDRDGQRRLLDQVAPEQMRSDIVVTGLPDQGEPLIQDLLDAIRPVLIIVGDDEWPPSRRGTDALYERLRDSSVTVLNTRLQGAIELHFDDNGWRATDAKGDVLAQSDSNALEPPF